MKKLGLILMLFGISLSFSQELVWTSNIVSSFLTSSDNEIKSIEDYLKIQEDHKLEYDGTCFANKTFKLTSSELFINSTWIDDVTGSLKEENHILEVRNLVKNGSLLEFECVSNNSKREVWKVIINLNFYVDDSSLTQVFYLSNTVRGDTTKGIVMFNCKIVSNNF